MRKPKVTRADSWGEVKVVPGMDVDVGLAFMAVMYFSDSTLVTYDIVVGEFDYLSDLQVAQHEIARGSATLSPKQYHHPLQQHQPPDSVSSPFSGYLLSLAQRFLAQFVLTRC